MSDLTYPLCGFKVRLPLFKRFAFILFNENLLIMIKNAFYFMLNALFTLEIFTFLSWLFVYVEKWFDSWFKTGHDSEIMQSLLLLRSTWVLPKHINSKVLTVCSYYILFALRVGICWQALKSMHISNEWHNCLMFDCVWFSNNCGRISSEKIRWSNFKERNTFFPRWRNKCCIEREYHFAVKWWVYSANFLTCYVVVFKDDY